MTSRAVPVGRRLPGRNAGEAVARRNQPCYAARRHWAYSRSMSQVQELGVLGDAPVVLASGDVGVQVVERADVHRLDVGDLPEALDLPASESICEPRRIIVVLREGLSLHLDQIFRLVAGFTAVTQKNLCSANRLTSRSHWVQVGPFVGLAAPFPQRKRPHAVITNAIRKPVGFRPA